MDILPQRPWLESRLAEVCNVSKRLSFLSYICCASECDLLGLLKVKRCKIKNYYKILCIGCAVGIIVRSNAGDRGCSPGWAI